MRLVTSVIVILSAAILSPAPAHSSDADLTAFRAATRALYDLEEKAYRDKDADTLVGRLYSDDAFVISPNSASFGKSQLLEGYKRHMDGTARLVSARAYVRGDSGYDLVNFYFTPDDNKEHPVTFKALLLWERRHGKWVCLGNMFMPGAFPGPETSAH
jgi:ketosteroid isomerase-like protein